VRELNYYLEAAARVVVTDRHRPLVLAQEQVLARVLLPVQAVAQALRHVEE